MALTSAIALTSKVMAYTVTAYTVMAYAVMAYTAMAYTAMAYVVMANLDVAPTNLCAKPVANIIAEGFEANPRPMEK